MILALLITAAIVAVSGLALKYFVPMILRDSNWSISWREFIAGLIVAYLVAMPAVFIAGKALSTADALRYEEFRNGVETSTTVNVEACEPGESGSNAASGHSNCENEYNTGETYTYTEIYYVTVDDGCDAKGENCKSHQEMRTRTEVAFIYNPYATKEYTYTVTDSLGGSYTFPYAYVKDGEGYGGKAIPADIPRGDPADWTSAKKRLDEGNPRPVTRLFDYNNYVLASHDDLLKPFSKNVKRYLKEGILPQHTKNITTNPLHGFNNSTADKVSFVGVKVSNPKAWQASLMTFDAALGSKLQGDLHLVLIDSSLVDNSTDYLNALKAYWLGDDLGRRAIAKNAIIVVAGVQGDTIKWGMASTGMPFGNEVMLRGIVNFLPNTPLNPKQVIGDPHTVVTPSQGGKDDVAVTLSDKPGVLERVVLQDFPFQRACMDCKNDGKQIGYANLVVDIEPKPWQFGIMIGIVSLLALVWWFIAGRYEFFNWIPGFKSSRNDEDNDSSSSYDPYRELSKSKKSKKYRRFDDVFNRNY
ncbi:MAG TPA: hypothetical protein VIM31_04205 [Candidatus Microsaccharimonas sp.]|jgi:hypothetical protein